MKTRTPLVTSRQAFSLVALAALLAAGAAAAVSASCVVAQSYVYSAQKYEPEGACLDPYTSIEVVPGEGASSSCPATCLTVGPDLYVSTMCPPLPAIATAVPDDAGACKEALAAASQEASCDAPADASGADGSEGGEEAGDDAGQEAGDGDTTDAADAPRDAFQDASDAG